MSSISHNISTVIKCMRHLASLEGDVVEGIGASFLEEVVLRLPSRVSIEISGIERARIVGSSVLPSLTGV